MIGIVCEGKKVIFTTEGPDDSSNDIYISCLQEISNRYDNLINEGKEIDFSIFKVSVKFKDEKSNISYCGKLTVKELYHFIKNEDGLLDYDLNYELVKYCNYNEEKCIYENEIKILESFYNDCVSYWSSRLNVSDELKKLIHVNALSDVQDITTNPYIAFNSPKLDPDTKKYFITKIENDIGMNKDFLKYIIRNSINDEQESLTPVF